MFCIEGDFPSLLKYSDKQEESPIFLQIKHLKSPIRHLHILEQAPRKDNLHTIY